MKKVFSIIITLVFIVSLCGINVLADEMPVFSLSNETASIGDEVSVKLSVENNSGLAALLLIVRFNTLALEPVSINKLDIFKGQFISNIQDPEGSLEDCSQIMILWANASNCYDNGDFCEIKFRVKDTAFQNVLLKLDYSPDDVGTQDYELVEIQTVDGSIEVLDGVENDEDSNYFDEYVDDMETVDPPTGFEDTYGFEPGKEFAETHPDLGSYTSDDLIEKDTTSDNQNNNPSQTNNNENNGNNGNDGQNTENNGNNSGTNTGNNTGNNSGTNTGNNTGNNEGTNSGNNTGNNDGTNSGNNTGYNEGTNSGNNTGNNSGTSTGNNAGTDTNTGNTQTQNNGNNTNDGTNQDTNASNINDGTSESGNTPAETDVSFTDISSHWAKDYANTMAGRGIFKGYEDGTFRPDIGLSRQEMAVSVVRLLGLEGELGTADIEKFTDDDEIADWAKDYVYLLVSKGIFKGYDDGSFGPRGIITREQLSLVLARALTNPPETLSELKFNDAEKISGWAKDAVATMVTLKIVGGYEDQTFRPQKDVTRAETCTMMYKFLENR